MNTAPNMTLQTSGFDVALGVITAVSAFVMPFVLVGAARWQNRKADEKAEAVAKTATDVAANVAKTVTEVAAKQDEKVERIHVLVNSQKTELEHTIKVQAQEIKRLLAANKVRRRNPRRK